MRLEVAREKGKKTSTACSVREAQAKYVCSSNFIIQANTRL